jgi:hypothetical protein
MSRLWEGENGYTPSLEEMYGLNPDVKIVPAVLLTLVVCRHHFFVFITAINTEE